MSHTIELSPVFLTGLIATVQTIAVISTCVRVRVQFSRDKEWCDDMYIICASTCSVLALAAFLVSTWRTSDHPGIQVFVNLSWIILHVGSIWFARISMAVSILRFSRSYFRLGAKIAVVTFAVIAVFLVALKLSLCLVKVNMAEHLDISFCRVPSSIQYFEIASGILSDLWIIIVPCIMVQRSTLTHYLHRLVIPVFLCNLLTLGATIVYGYLSLKGRKEILAAGQVQATISIIVSNFLILTPCVRRWLQRRISTKPPQIPSWASGPPGAQPTIDGIPIIVDPGLELPFHCHSVSDEPLVSPGLQSGNDAINVQLHA